MNFIFNDEQLIKAIQAVPKPITKKRLLRYFYNDETHKDEFSPKCSRCVYRLGEPKCDLYGVSKGEYLKAVQCASHKKRDWRVVISDNSNIGKMFTKNNVKLEEYGERYYEN